MTTPPRFLSLTIALCLCTGIPAAAQIDDYFPRQLAATQPATRPAPLYPNAAPGSPEFHFDSQRQRLLGVRQPEGVYRAEDLPRLRLRDGVLAVDVPEAVKTVNQSTRLRVEGSACEWVLIARPNRERHRVYLDRLDFARFGGEELWAHLLTCTEGFISITSYGGQKSPAFSAQLVQRAEEFRLLVYGLQDGRSGPVIFNQSARDLAVFYAAHPQEARRYLTPMLEAYAGMDLLKAGAAEVYRVFPEVQPTQTERRRLDEAITLLGSPSGEQRAAASAELAKLGRRGVLAALRLDLAEYAPEERARLQQFIDSHSRTGSAPGPSAAAELRRSAVFLIDCLEDEDAAVRALAGLELAAVLGREVGIAADAKAEVRAAAADRLRASVYGKRPPATAPAE